MRYYLHFKRVVAYLDLKLTQNIMIEVEQRVKQFYDEEWLAVQTASLDTTGEPWIVVMHKEKELSMSVENWKLLVKMTNKLIAENMPKQKSNHKLI